MDTSKEYILMCEKAEEIQKQWEPKEWDYVYNQDDVFGYIDRSEIHIWCILPESIADSGYYGPYLYDGEICDERYKDCIWIPRQDQLQEMLSQYENMTLLFKFNEFCSGKMYRYQEPSRYLEIMLDTFEKLWLAFVMKEYFNKRWNGKEWEVWLNENN